MSDTPVQEPIIPLRVPASHLKVLFAGLGKLPLEVAGPTDAFLKNQINQLAALAKAQAEKDAAAKNAINDALALPEIPAVKNKRSKPVKDSK